MTSRTVRQRPWAALLLLLLFFAFADCRAESLRRFSVRSVDGQDILCDSYTVQPGDFAVSVLSLRGQIAYADFPQFLRLLRKLNPRVSDINRIYPGQKLVIPIKIMAADTYSGQESGSVSLPTVTIRPAAPAPGMIARAPSSEAYRVAPGDSISGILAARFGPMGSEAYEKAYAEFKALNPSIKNPSRIFAGTTLVLPLQRSGTSPASDRWPEQEPGQSPDQEPGPGGEAPPEGASTSPAALAGVAGEPGAAGKGVSGYTVRSGDSVSRILARRFGPYGSAGYKKALDRFVRLNPEIKDLNLILAGDTLNIPETLEEIAEEAAEEPEPAEEEPAQAEPLPEPEEEPEAEEAPTLALEPPRPPVTVIFNPRGSEAPRKSASLPEVKKRTAPVKAASPKSRPAAPEAPELPGQVSVPGQALAAAAPQAPEPAPAASGLMAPALVEIPEKASAEAVMSEAPKPRQAIPAQPRPRPLSKVESAGLPKAAPEAVRPPEARPLAARAPEAAPVQIPVAPEAPAPQKELSRAPEAAAPKASAGSEAEPSAASRVLAKVLAPLVGPEPRAEEKPESLPKESGPDLPGPDTKDPDLAAKQEEPPIPAEGESIKATQPEEKGPALPLSPLALPLTDATIPEGSVRALDRAAGLLDSQLLSKGEYFLPREGRPDLRLDLSQTPVLELPEGRRIILLPDGQRLPENVLDDMRKVWKDLTPVSVLGKKPGPRELLGQVLGAAGIEVRDTSAELKDGPVTVKVSADLLFANPKGGLMAVNFVESQEERTLPLASRVLKRLGVQMVDLGPGKEPDKPEEPRPRVSELPSGSCRKLVAAVCELMGVSYAPDVPVTFPYAGFSLTMMSNMARTADGKEFLVDFGSLYGQAQEALTGLGLPLIQLGRQAESAKTVEKLLSAMGMPLDKPAPVYAARRSGPRVSFAISGLAHKDSSSLFVNGPLQDDMALFLNSLGFRLAVLPKATCSG